MDKNQYSDFIKRLNYHCKGEGVRNHCTADVLFLVEQRICDSGYDLDYTDDKCAYDHLNEVTYWNPEDFWPEDEDSSELRERLNKVAQFYWLNKDFLDLNTSQQWEVLQEFSEQLTISGYKERWEYVSAHFTVEAAEAWIKRKGHNYGELRIYGSGQTYCWEFNEVKDLLLSGKLVYKQGIKEKSLNLLKVLKGVLNAKIF